MNLQGTNFCFLVNYIYFESNNNIVLFDSKGIGGATNIGNFNVDDDCVCVKPINRKLSLVFENKENDVWIFENDLTALN